jgi:hypothetical protein
MNGFSFVEEAKIDARIQCGAVLALCRWLATGTADSTEHAEKMICVLSAVSG